MSLFTLHTGMDSFPDKNFNHIYSTDTVLKLCSEDSFNNILEQTLYTRTFTLCSEGDLKATHVHTYIRTYIHALPPLQLVTMCLPLEQKL